MVPVASILEHEVEDRPLIVGEVFRLPLDKVLDNLTGDLLVVNLLPWAYFVHRLA